MQFQRELVLTGTYLFNNVVYKIDVWIEGIGETHSDYVVNMGDNPPFRITQDEEWNWIEVDVGETERAEFVGDLIDRKTM